MPSKKSVNITNNGQVIKLIMWQENLDILWEKVDLCFDMKYIYF